MKKNDPAAAAMACALALVLTVSYGAAGQAQEAAWAQPQQAALAEDILSADEDQHQRAVLVAAALGPSRMSEDVRVALITLLEQSNDKLDAASAEGVALNNVVKGEFFLQVGDVVAALNDPRAIPALARFGNYGSSKHVARGLASFGEQALPAILETIDTPEMTNFAVDTNLLAIAMMVENGGANGLSASARDDIVRVAGDGLRSQRRNAILSAIDIAIALDEQDLIQTVTALSQDSGALAARGISQITANLIRQRAVDALARTAEER